MMLGVFQDTKIDLDVIFCTTKFCGGSSGAAGQSQNKVFILNRKQILYVVNADNCLLRFFFFLT